VKSFAAKIAAIASAAALMGAVVAVPAQAADPFNATISGQRNFTPLVNLVSTSTLTINATNLPANVGLYALNCEVPANPRSAPTNCDSAEGSLAYIPAIPTARAAIAIPIKVNAEFYGTNPNPQTGASTYNLVDCRKPGSTPQSTTCAVYVLGAGREAANPAYLRIWPTVFTPLAKERTGDSMTVTVAGTVVKRGATAKIAAGAPTAMTVKMASGLPVTVSSDNCAVRDNTVTPLTPSGTCNVVMTSNGGKNIKPFKRVQVLTIG
jgi:hypothetical protein